MKHFNYCLTLILLGLAGSTYACDLMTISKRLSSESFAARFEQNKQIEVLASPLISRGQMYLSTNNGLVWQLQRPLKSTSVFSSNIFKQFDSRDQEVTFGSAVVQHRIQQFAKIFVDLVGGKLNRLHDDFDTKVECNGEQWSLLMKPRKDRLSRVLRNVNLTGSENINTISIEEVGGDITHINITEVTHNKDQNNLREYFER